MTKVAVFDLDGTLLDSAPDIHAAVNRVIGRRGHAPYSLDEVKAMIGDGMKVLTERFLAGRGQPYDEACHDELVADEDIRFARLTTPFEGIAEALGAIRAAGWRLAVCTNKPEGPARALLASVGLGDHFAAIGGGDSFPVRKPHPDHLRATLAAAGGAADTAIMVGDHRNDVMAAAGAGIPCIFVDWGYGPASMAGDAPIATRPADLPAMVAALRP